ncbi:hypothetical protein F511_13103 [Dorcoceras hygrometricum]|uniref:Uncharacterized protein n=1 Tax=Dorcoceras hygrometricum TaxID=472368 RepID=A0A2Z7ASL3_9LAMI|nr:hypothetical protein F511_13103 [Dorcoceras hygrometricum]
MRILRRGVGARRNARLFSSETRGHPSDQDRSAEIRGQQPQPLNLVPKITNKPSCPICNKNQAGQCRVGQNVCYRFGDPGYITRKYPQPKQPITIRACMMRDDQENPYITEASGKITSIAGRQLHPTLAYRDHGKGNYADPRYDLLTRPETALYLYRYV